MTSWYENGKLKKGKYLPNGLYNQYSHDDRPHLIDRNFEGFRIIYIKDDGKKRQAPSVITDSIELKSMHDGRMYTSKSKYYDALKQTGSHVLEKGENYGRKEVRGDFNLRKELTQATKEVLSKH
jgi:hypothetical protein